MKLWIRPSGVLMAATLAWSIASCAQSSPQTVPPAETTPITTQTTTPATPPPAEGQLPDAPGAPAPAQPALLPSGPIVVLDTSMGRITCKLFSKRSPLAAANFIGLAEGTKPYTDPVTGKQVTGKPFYDGTTFHRVIPGFMIQGGDRRGDGTGDAGYYFDNENTPGLSFDVAGRLAMANSGENTNSSQFFVTELPQPDLNGRYTIFGQCDSHSVLIVASIARVDRNAQDKPLAPVMLDKVTIVPEGQPMPPLPPSSTPSVDVPAAPATAQPSASTPPQ